MQQIRLNVVYIRASHYDDDGYPLRYWRGTIPSNTLNCLKTLTLSSARSEMLQTAGIHVSVSLYDDMTQRIPIKRLARLNRRKNTCVLVGLAGVQTNQFPRASDLALAFRREGVPVMIGGFHVSGILGMFHKPSDDMQRLLDAGVTLIKGEVEAPGKLAEILLDGACNRLRPIYDIAPPPSLLQAPAPRMDEAMLQRATFKNVSAFDTSRGCPFACNFCSIITVQGRKMRHRSTISLLEMVETEYRRGINAYFITDDNFSRSPIWEEFLDGLIALRRDKNIAISFMAQVDAQAHRIPRFVEKMTAAGCNMIFLGMESLDSRNLEAAAKYHNKADAYDEMVKAWRNAHVLVHVGYIVGFPYDTSESVRHAVLMLRDVLKIDQISFFMLTPIPGSVDHKRMIDSGTPLDADLNNYDSLHATFRHPRMSGCTWQEAYFDAWRRFYTKESMVNALLRTPPQRYWKLFWMFVWSRFCAIEGAHPMLTGLVRLRSRKDRRDIFQTESVTGYAKSRIKEILRMARIYAMLFFEFEEIWLLTRRPEEPRWSVLADLRETWQTAKSRLQYGAVIGHYDDVVKELTLQLSRLAETLKRVDNMPGAFGRRLYRKMKHSVTDVEGYVRRLERQQVTLPLLTEIQTYVEQGVVRRYENVALGYVAWRRKLNGYRRRFRNHIRTGHVFTMEMLKLPFVISAEFIVGARFCLSALHHM